MLSILGKLYYGPRMRRSKVKYNRKTGLILVQVLSDAGSRTHSTTLLVDVGLSSGVVFSVRWVLSVKDLYKPGLSFL